MPQSDRIPGGFVRPFRTAHLGLYIFDAAGHMAADLNENGLFRPRGWGRIQKMPNADADMDAWEAWALARCAGLSDLREAAELLNEEAADDR